MPVVPYPLTSVRSRFFDSRLSSRPGDGFPSCETALCRLPGNRNDPAGYYAEIGVPPWATPAEIRTRVRKLYQRYHPDTGAQPDPDRLTRVKLIAEVLLDPEQRDRYNHTPPGKRLMDALYRSELLDVLNLAEIGPEELQNLLRPVGPPPPRRSWSYDYLAVDPGPWDGVLSRRWYACLLHVAPVVGYRRRIKVLLHDGPAFFHADTAVMAIPRAWTPSTGLAFALFTAVAGIRPGCRE